MTTWSELPLATRLQKLRTTALADIAKDYAPADGDAKTFLEQLAQEQTLWDVTRNDSAPVIKGGPPTKDILLGAWRDLDRSEALAELIDNSIDHWRQRVGDEDLRVSIRYDDKNELLIYEDNAGGVRELNLNNLVIPGYSDTVPNAPTIGSYKTGGKKAIFRLASAARIDTWAEGQPTGASVLLDEAWMNDQAQYQYSYVPLTSQADFSAGRTRYVFRLRDDLPGVQWPQSTDAVEKITRALRKTYTLLLIRNPRIRISFLSNAPLSPLEDFYQFSAAHDDAVDLRPQQVVFELPPVAATPVCVEVVLGFRRTSGAKGFQGIDLYGNNRLFVENDQNLGPELLNKSTKGPLLIRGLINIQGPNPSVPWDTHKRHLNLDSEILSQIRQHRGIRELFDNWAKAATDVSSLQVVKKLIDVAPRSMVDSKKHDLWVQHRAKDPVPMALAPKAAGLPSTIFVPVAKAPTMPIGWSQSVHAQTDSAS